MNVAELIESYFGPAAAQQLGRVAGLEATDAEQVLRQGLPLQLAGLADHARTPEGEAQIAEAVQNLPTFTSVEVALNDPEGAGHLQQAGELLAPALLGPQAGTLAGPVAGSLDTASVQRLLHMAFPLLLSFLGQRGLTTGKALSGLKEDLAKSGLATAAGGAGSALTAAGLVEFLKGQFSGPAADQLGKAAGFSGGTATRAAQAALPLVLKAVADKGHTEAGAADLLGRSRDFARFTDADGQLNTALLSDPAEAARIEGQGRGLLGSLFGNVDAVTGRFGSAVGGSGASAGRLLALLAPLVLSLLAGRARAGNLNPGSLSRLLGEVGPLLPALLPAGLTSLGPLLTAPAQVTTVAAAVTPPPRLVETPPPAPPSAPVTPVAPAPPARRGGFPWWLIPLLLLLLLGGCWLLQRRPTLPAAVPTTTGATSNSILVTNPASGATLPPEDFVMSGTAPAGDTLSIEDQGQQVASANVGTDGQWQAAIPAPTVGEHTYTISGKDSGTRSEFKVNVRDAGSTPANGGASNTGSGDANGTAPNDAATGDVASTFAITEPAADAQLPAGGFTLRGTGKAGETVQVLEDGTSLGNVTVLDDGTWSLNVPSPAAGAHTYTVQGVDGTELGRVSATVAAAAAGASAADCTKTYTLSISDGQTVSEPFRFGGVGQGQGYSVTVKRGERTIGTKSIPLDATCGWSYQSRPGAGRVTYEVRSLGDAGAAPLSTVTLTVKP
ncbi:hypothetical protein DEIPH_ctg032orf0004 [Deinococcus phoenicis]|uniref:DUF937 domain-containing protein n=1 Tax=Deinococcus phoenicis TaxID=1476583 RepID=A0A016QP47_9DEIO|nr:DUF937 domain-containing protein [Deinococcus phoenicis]EYB67771.1 hypothetical protein DEIPH_ctg032orf0004 [Deinococcus phoenicis]